MTITVGGSNITFPDATTQTTAYTGGGVTSAVAGNGVAVSASTGAVTFSASCPGFNTVGSTCFTAMQAYSANNFTIVAGTNYAAGGGSVQVQSGGLTNDQLNGFTQATQNNLSGTWKNMSATRVISAAGAYDGVGYQIHTRVA